MEYPKIETLYDRNEKFKVNPMLFRRPEFKIVRNWEITEKIDGTNIRISWTAFTQQLRFDGRTDNAQIPANLFEYLSRTFKPEMFIDFQDDTIIFGEGYGEKIQSGGNYRNGVSFRVFDVLVGKWWLEYESANEICSKMNVAMVPLIGTLDEFPNSFAELVDVIPRSEVALLEKNKELQAEGIVAKSSPMLFNRYGERVMWKLKFKDF
jgi:ATP-dependent RNA circularization protein (DNA/RNA ligase family)